MTFEIAQMVLKAAGISIYKLKPEGMEGAELRHFFGEKLQFLLRKETALSRALDVLRENVGLARTMEWTIHLAERGPDALDVVEFMSDELLYTKLLARLEKRIVHGIRPPPWPIVPDNVSKDVFALAFSLGSTISKGDSDVIMEAVKALGEEAVMKWAQQVVGTATLIVQFQLVTAEVGMTLDKKPE